MQWDEVEELACLMLGKDYDSIVNNYNNDCINNMFIEEYNLNLGDFEYLLRTLVKFTPSWTSPLTGELFQGFVVPEDNLMRAIIKEKVNYG